MSMNPEPPTSRAQYRGRFAPSPTGPLHFGALVAAVGSYLQAKAQRGEWLVRIEDIDAPREAPGAAGDILRTLDVYGLHWDGEVLYQRHRREAYDAALEKLRQAGALYACACSRREISDSSVRGIEGPVYPGTCRAGLAPGRAARAWRVRTESRAIEFGDGVQGRVRSVLQDDVGDFVVQRADGFFAYQLAVVVDDAAQDITEVVRGADLLNSTPRQIHLQRLLGLPTPAYRHLPVVLSATGEKLSKQTGAAPIDRHRPVPVLWAALDFLGQAPEPDWREADLENFWRLATAHWTPARIPRVAKTPDSDLLKSVAGRNTAPADPDVAGNPAPGTKMGTGA